MSTPTPTLFDLALRDVLNARGITSTGMCRATGNHLAAQNDEPEFSESELLAGDKERAEFSVQREVDRAHEDEVQRMRCLGAL